jgi:predicted DNA-binding transcriptional regulator AlpA
LTERLLTARELGELLGLSTSTVLDRFERGDLAGFRLFGKKGGRCGSGSPRWMRSSGAGG